MHLAERFYDFQLAENDNFSYYREYDREKVINTWSKRAFRNTFKNTCTWRSIVKWAKIIAFPSFHSVDEILRTYAIIRFLQSIQSISLESEIARSGISFLGRGMRPIRYLFSIFSIFFDDLVAPRDTLLRSLR